VPSAPAIPVVVVGLGAVGASALLSLARRGIPCLGIDRFSPPHDLGSSHGHSRLIRLCYFEHPDYVPLLHAAYRLWDRLQHSTTTPIIRRTGGLYLGTPGDPFVQGSLQSARAHSLPHEVLDEPTLHARFPMFRPRTGEVGFFEPSAGVLFPEAAIDTSLREARRLGARTVTDQAVRDWHALPSGAISIRTDQQTLLASSLILAAGAWMPELAPHLKHTLAVTRQVLAWLYPRDADALFTPYMPAWAVGQAHGSAHYGFPLFRDPLLGGPGFKLALHAQGDPADPDHVDRRVRDSELESLIAFARERIPDACRDRDPVALARVCLYTSTPDQHFLIDHHPAHRNVILVSACSGHGFKLAPVMGDAAADLASTGSTPHPIHFLRTRW
jgi:sarcosine oxidase